MKSYEIKPINPKENELCYEEDTERLYQFKNGWWVLVGHENVLKVYVLLESNSFTDYEFCGVFFARDQAQKRLDEIVKEIPRQKDSLYIEEY